MCEGERERERERERIKVTHSKLECRATSGAGGANGVARRGAVGLGIEAAGTLGTTLADAVAGSRALRSSEWPENVHT